MSSALVIVVVVIVVVLWITLELISILDSTEAYYVEKVEFRINKSVLRIWLLSFSKGLLLIIVFVPLIRLFHEMYNEQPVVIPFLILFLLLNCFFGVELIRQSINFFVIHYPKLKCVYRLGENTVCVDGCLIPIEEINAIEHYSTKLGNKDFRMDLGYSKVTFKGDKTKVISHFAIAPNVWIDKYPNLNHSRRSTFWTPTWKVD
jgi:hypothetical protein